MSAIEMWVCDYCSPDGPEEEGDVVHEDTARDQGWVRLHRTATHSYPSGLTFKLPEQGHVCDRCIGSVEVGSWIIDQGWRRED